MTELADRFTTLSPRQASWAVFLLALAFAVWFQGSRSLWGTDEGRYTMVAVQMLESGDWLVPHRHPEHPHLSKPPLTYWALASSMVVFGRNEWALRLPGALAFAGTMLLLWQLGRQFVPERPALPPLIYASMLVPMVAAQIISTDVLLTFFMTLGMFGLIRAAAQPVEVGRWARLCVVLGFGLGFLTKGPPALLPLLAFLLYRWRHPGDRGGVPFTCLSTTGLVAVAASWFVVMISLRPELLAYFVGDEFVSRIASDVHDRNAQWYGPITVFGPVIVVGAMPWNLIFAWRAWRGQLHPRHRLLRYWMLVSLAVFCLARSRLPLYIAPLFVPAALYLAMALRDISLRWLPWYIAALLLFKATLSYLPHAKDAQAIASALAAAADGPISEVLFLDESPQYAVGFYLGVNVETISSTATLSTAIDQDLASELQEPGENRIWLMHCDRTAVSLAALAALGHPARYLTRVDRYCAYHVDPTPSASLSSR